MANLSDLEPLIIQEWLTRKRAGQRTEDDIFSFYGQLEKEKSKLLSFRALGDKYQMLKTILRNHIER